MLQFQSVSVQTCIMCLVTNRKLGHIILIAYCQKNQRQCGEEAAPNSWVTHTFNLAHRQCVFFFFLQHGFPSVLTKNKINESQWTLPLTMLTCECAGEGGGRMLKKGQTVLDFRLKCRAYAQQWWQRNLSEMKRVSLHKSSRILLELQGCLELQGLEGSYDAHTCMQTHTHVLICFTGEQQKKVAHISKTGTISGYFYCSLKQIICIWEEMADRGKENARGWLLHAVLPFRGYSSSELAWTQMTNGKQHSACAPHTLTCSFTHSLAPKKKQRKQEKKTKKQVKLKD